MDMFKVYLPVCLSVSLFVCRFASIDHSTAHDKQSKHNQLCFGRLGAPIIQLCFPHIYTVSQKCTHTYEHKFIQYAHTVVRKTHLMANIGRCILKVCKHTRMHTLKTSRVCVWIPQNGDYVHSHISFWGLYFFCFTSTTFPSSSLLLVQKIVYDHVLCVCIYASTWCTNVRLV